MEIYWNKHSLDAALPIQTKKKNPRALPLTQMGYEGRDPPLQLSGPITGSSNFTSLVRIIILL